MREDGGIKIGTVFKLVLSGIVGLMVLFSVFGSWYTVSEQERAVVTTWGSFTRVDGPGLKWKFPFMQSVTEYKITIQDENSGKDPVNINTAGNQELFAQYTSFFRIPADKVEFVFKVVPDYHARLNKMMMDTTKEIFGLYNVTEVSEKRGEIRDRIKKNLAAKAIAELGLEIVDFQLNDITFTKDYRIAIDKAAVAKANVEAAMQQQREETVKAETARITALGAANKTREEQRGIADGRLFVAEAEAKGIALKLAAEAEGIDKKNKALRDGGAALATLTQAERWNGSVPQWITGGSASPFPIMNVQPPK